MQYQYDGSFNWLVNLCITDVIVSLYVIKNTRNNFIVKIGTCERYLKRRHLIIKYSTRPTKMPTKSKIITIVSTRWWTVGCFKTQSLLTKRIESSLKLTELLKCTIEIFLCPFCMLIFRITNEVKSLLIYFVRSCFFFRHPQNVV